MTEVTGAGLEPAAFDALLVAASEQGKAFAAGAGILDADASRALGREITPEEFLKLWEVVLISAFAEAGKDAVKAGASMEQAVSVSRAFAEACLAGLTGERH